MLRRVDLNAHLNRWRDKTGAVALFCAGLMACAFLAPAAPPVVFAVAWLAALAGARVRPADFARAFLVPAVFLLAGAAVLCVSLEIRGGLRLALSPEGARTAVLATARAAAALSVTLLFAFTTPVSHGLALLARLRVPGPLIALMADTYRMIFLLDQGRSCILRAQHNRLGYRGPRAAFRSTGLAAAALFTRAHHRAVRLERGLQSRGFTGALPVLLPPSAATARDYAFALAAPALVAGAALLPGPLPL